MTEEVKSELHDAPEASGGAPPEPTPAPEVNYEELARAEGWRPKAELGDAYDPLKYVSAEEFVKRAPLFLTIKSQSKAIKELRKTVESVVSFSKQNAELAAKQAIDNLLSQKRDAIVSGDVEASPPRLPSGFPKIPGLIMTRNYRILQLPFVLATPSGIPMLRWRMLLRQLRRLHGGHSLTINILPNLGRPLLHR